MSGKVADLFPTTVLPSTKTNETTNIAYYSPLTILSHHVACTLYVASA